MKNLPCVCLAAFLALVVPSANASVRYDGVFLQTDFANSLRVGNNVTNTPSIAFASGGNVGGYPGPQDQVPKNTNAPGGIFLRQSVIGHAVAVSPEIVTSMLTKALAELKGGVGYINLVGETNDHGRADGEAWDIRFPGVVDPVNTNNSAFTFTNATFHTNRTVAAADYYRAALRADPFNLTAAHGLLRTYYERMAAYTFAGHNGAERAARVRLLFGDINTEISNLEVYTLKFYTNATDELNLLTSRPLEAQLFDGSYPHLPPAALAPNRNRLLEAYARALTHQAETVFKLGRLKQFNDYGNPLIDTTVNFTGLLNNLAAQRAAIAERQLLLDLAPELTRIARTELGRCRHLLDRIQSLESAIENGRIAFVSAHNEGTESQPIIRFTFQEYSPDHVPFHALNAQGQKTHDQFLGIAADFRVWAVQRETEAIQSVRDFDVQEFAHQSSLSDITNRYFRELATLCGQIRAEENGSLV